jgi:thiol-disulfide isomerase/thioredoxin
MRQAVRWIAALGVAVALLSSVAAQAQAPTDLVADVRAATGAGDFPKAEAIVAAARAERGDTPEALAALSWLARGALAAKDLDTANRYATETYRLVEQALKTTALDSDAFLQTALGAAIETRALVQVERGNLSDAVYNLGRELEIFRDTGIHKRLEKNINLLTLEGQPAPALVTDEHLDRATPGADELRGKVVLLFFWAHWCPDCKAQSPIIAGLLDKYRAQGLVVVAPTQRFGYVANNAPATPDEELRYIVEIRDIYYPFLKGEAVPVSDANHKRYGVSSTPTLALVDREGIVRVYHPGRMTEEELDEAIRKLL